MSELGTSSFGTYGDPARSCARWTEKYTKLHSKGAAPWRVRRAKKKMDKYCSKAQSTSDAFESAYQSVEEQEATLVAQNAIASTAGASFAPGSKMPLFLLLGGAAVVAALILSSGGQGERKGPSPSSPPARVPTPYRRALA